MPTVRRVVSLVGLWRENIAKFIQYSSVQNGDNIANRKQLIVIIFINTKRYTSLYGVNLFLDYLQTFLMSVIEFLHNSYATESKYK